MAKRTKADAAPNPAIKRCIDAFHDAHLRRHGTKPLINGGKDGQHMKHLLATWGEEAVLQMIGLFFTTTDPRVLRSDYNVGAFYALASHLRLLDRRIGQRTAENLDAATRATRSQETRWT